MRKTDLRKTASIRSSFLAKLSKDDNTTDVLLRICEALTCALNGIMETVFLDEE